MWSGAAGPCLLSGAVTGITDFRLACCGAAAAAREAVFAHLLLEKGEHRSEISDLSMQ